MKPKFRVILEECVERGVARGYRRAFKHSDSPKEETIFAAIEDCVMGEIYEYFDFDDSTD
jgi:hypothetical protein